MTDSEIRALLTDDTALALTMWAEARGDSSQGRSSVEERIAVGCVIRNRARAASRSILAVCLQPWQFSCWNPGDDRNHRALMAMAEALVTHRLLEDPVMIETLYLASGIIGDVIVDRTFGATHYYAPDAMVPPGRVPSWVPGMEQTAVIGKQVFYRYKKGADHATKA
jgi:N-acetylmuramoyl-L-alanine amidase